MYPFGLDPTWFLDENSILLIQNSFKMKMAVIIGVTHMTMGICVKGLNQIYFRRPIVLVFEVITGLIILLGLFGWMDFLIIAKWLQPYNAYNYLLADTDPTQYDKEFNFLANAPSIYNLMIANFLAGGVNYGYNTTPGNNSEYGNYLFPGQRGISETLVVMVLICIPLYLCVKPCVAMCAHKDEAEPHGEQFQQISEAEGMMQQENEGYKLDLIEFEALLIEEFGAKGHGDNVGELFIH